MGSNRDETSSPGPGRPGRRGLQLGDSQPHLDTTVRYAGADRPADSADGQAKRHHTTDGAAKSSGGCADETRCVCPCYRRRRPHKGAGISAYHPAGGLIQGDPERDTRRRMGDQLFHQLFHEELLRG